MVKLGHINYLNCLPVHGAILLGKIPFDGEIIEGPPSYLNKLLDEGILDVSPSSSFEIIKGHKIIPNFSISSKQEVKSIILITKNDLTMMKKGVFFITAHSQTSSMLIKLILKEFIPLKADYLVFTPENEKTEELLKKADGILYIGDYALKNFDFPNTFKYDLAKIWYDYTKLPFTFALWQVSKKNIQKAEIKSLIEVLKGSYQFFLKNKELLADRFSNKMGFEKNYIIQYWNNLSFDLNERHIESLTLFFRLLKKNNLIDREPEISFFC